MVMLLASFTLVACSPERQEAARLGFETVDQMKAAHAAGFHTRERQLQHDPVAQAEELDRKSGENAGLFRALDGSPFADTAHAGRCVAVLEAQPEQIKAVNTEDSRVYASIAEKLVSYAVSRSDKEALEESQSRSRAEIKASLEKGPAAQDWYIENVINRSADCAETFLGLEHSKGGRQDGADGANPERKMTRLPVYNPMDEWYQLVCTGHTGVAGIRAREINCGDREAVTVALEQAFNWLRHNRDALPSEGFEDACWKAYNQVKDLPPADIMPWAPDSGSIFLGVCTMGGLVPARQWVEQQRR